MPDPFQPVRRGSPLEISAAQMNGVLAGGKDFSRRKLNDGDTSEGGAGNGPANQPQIYNGLTAAIDQFAILGFGVVPTIDTGAAPFEASTNPIFTAAAPTAGRPFCITREPIPVGSIGQIVTNGPAVVQIQITDATHTRAIPVTNDKAKLTSAAGGGIPILDRENGPGLKWGKVLVGEPAAGFYSGTTDAFIDVLSTGNVTVSGLGTVAVYNSWGTPIAAGKPCFIVWITNNGRFEFVPFDNGIYAGVTAGAIASASNGNVTVAGVGTMVVFNQWTTTIETAKRCLIGWVAHQQVFQFLSVDC